MIVERVANLLLLKLVRFTAPTAERCEWQTLVTGYHDLRTAEYALKVQPGDGFTLPYPGWVKLRVGQAVALDAIRRHPFGPRGQRV
ncbi:hypothetical protein [Sphingomonas sp. 66-10]|uniref:hypothetical protein n=1 Tax=Sphingomonas sp. 66-10 TaxID=1895848 RepID=UPI00257BF09D|nr:hypothetical protein [Sphingomonas sp. 66-10]